MSDRGRPKRLLATVVAGCFGLAGFVVAGQPALAAPASSTPAPTTPPPAPPTSILSPRPLAPLGPGPAPTAPPTAVAPPVAPVAPGPTVGDGAASAAAAPPAPPPTEERHLPTLDATPAESDHEAVRDAWGVQVRPVATKLSAFALRPGTGCAVAASTATTGACPEVTVSELVVRRWMGSNLAWNGGLAFALGGGSDSGRLLDTYFGIGPVLGASILLANWRHLAVSANPELSLVFFKGAQSADTAYVANLTADLEAEVHFGFIGVPALAIGLRSGLLFRLEHAGDATAWSLGVGGATSVRGLFEDLALRYYF